MKNYNAGIYLRLSKDDGTRESSSIASQRMVVTNFANEHGYEIQREFCDDGFSGTNFDRPAFCQMLEAVEKSEINMIIVKDLSRLGRDYIMTGKYTEEYFPMMNVRFVAVNDNFDSENGDSDLAPFRNVINEMYARDISRKIRTSLYAKMRNGQFVGNFPPYGYKKENHKLVIDKDSSRIVKRIYNEVFVGNSLKQIADQLNNDNVLSPLDYRADKLKREALNIPWTPQALRKIIKNPVYIGKLVQGKSRKPTFKSKKPNKVSDDRLIIVENSHQPVVSRELYIITNKAISISISSQRKSPLSGLITCGKCGKTLKISRMRNIVCDNQCLNRLSITEQHVLEKINKFLIKNDIRPPFQDMTLIEKLININNVTILYNRDIEIRAVKRDFYRD